MLETLRRVAVHAEDFQSAAHQILSRHETASKSRIVSIEKSRRQVQGLTLNQSELLREALDCVEFALYRAAYVSAWQAYVDLLTEKLASDGFVKVGQVRPKWPRIATAEDLREFTNEHELIVVARGASLISKAEVRILQGMLSKRNECAHPGIYRPNLNESLGFVSEIINRMDLLSSKIL